MRMDRDDLLLAFRALKRGHLAPADVRRAFKKGAALEVRMPLLEVLKTGLKLEDETLGPLRTLDFFPDLRTDRAILDELSAIVVELGLGTAAEFEKILQTLRPAQAVVSLLPPLEVPQKLGEYEVRWEMARSERNVVFRGHHHRHGEVSLKICRPGMVPEGLQCRVTGSHPGLARVLEVFEAAGLTVVALEFAGGEPLSKLLAGRKITPRAAFEILERAGRTMAELHGKGVYHGSLHASDILVQKGAVRIKDYGGVPGSASGDLRVFAEILYEAAAGVPPLPGEVTPVAPVAINKSLEPDADRIVRRAMASGYASMAELVEDLGRFLRHEPVAEPVRRGPRRPNIVWIAAAGVLLGVALAVMAFRSGRDKKPPAPEPVPEARRESRPDEPVREKPAPETAPRREEAKGEEASGVPLTRDELIRLEQEAYDLFSKRDFSKLEKLSSEVLRRGPKCYWACFYGAHVRFDRGEAGAAALLADEALRLKTDDPDAIHLRFACRMVSGEVASSLKDLEARHGRRWAEVNGAIQKIGGQMEREPKDGMLPFERGLLFAYKRNFDRAVEDYTRAIDRGRRSALHFRARARSGLGEWKEALADVEAYLAEFPQSSGAAEAKLLKDELQKKAQ